MLTCSGCEGWHVPHDRMWFTVLGPVRVWLVDREIDLGTPQQRTLLALLLVHANQPVSQSEIVDVMWGQDPPDSALNSVHRYVGTLRRALEPGLAPRDAGMWLSRSSGGYRLHGDANTIDLLRFRQLIRQARDALAGNAAAAVALYAKALELWQGPAAAGLGSEIRGHPMFTALDQEYLAAAREAADTVRATGEPQALLPVVAKAADRGPLDEALQARLMLMLASAGRQAAALELFEKVSGRLAEELGIDPGPELAAARDRVLRQGATPVQQGAATAPRATTTPGGVRPAQLPADLSTFSGRAAEMAAALALHVDEARAPGVVVIGGLAGVGKTTFAVHWAHLIASRFPDGQLYVNLRGFDPDGQVMEPSEAVRRFLEALDVPPGRIPVGLDAQAALLRSHLAGRRILILLDNARNTAQVRPVLPGSSTCFVLVTSRDRLAGLIASDGAHPIALELMSASEARQLLISRLGEDRVALDPEAVEDVIALCDRLPIALAIVSARAATHLHVPFGTLARELRDATARLDLLTTGDPETDVRAVFSWSYHALTEGAARLFRLLGLHPGPDISALGVANLVALAPAQAQKLLDEVVRVGLVAEHAHGRYALHDLLRAYASTLAHDTETEAERRAAIDRILDYYLHTGFAGDRLLSPVREPMALFEPGLGVTLPHLADRQEALAWFAAERSVLLAAIDHTSAAGLDRRTVELAWTMTDFLTLQGMWHDQVATQSAAVMAAQRLDDLKAEAYAYRDIAYANTRLGRFQESRTHLDASLDLTRRLGDHTGEAYTHLAIGMVWDRQGGHREALDHAQQALALFQRAGHRRGQANALSSAGWEHAQLGDFRQALTACREALEAFQEIDDRAGQSNTWDSVGYAHHELGEYAEAIACYHHSLDLVRELGDRYGEATVLTHLGDSHRAMGEEDEARTTLQRALTILEDLEHPDAEAVRTKLSVEGH
jgi:DNA-binding SARP family transcriptional activator